jgi:hypothetical protein
VLVLGAGLSRTGTVSLKAALEELGYGPCLHGFDFLGNPARIRAWIAASRQRDEVDWATLLQGYNSALDLPVAAFWKEISEYYPDVRVVLSIRDEDAWYASVRQTLFRWALPSHPRIRRVITRFLKATSGWLPPFPALGAEVVHEGLFHNRLDKEGAIAAYRRHNEAVLSTIPPERLLVWQASDGWQPLCAFLEVPVPDHPFPRLNDRTTMGGLLRQFPKEAARQVILQGRQSFARLLPGRGPAVHSVEAPQQDRRDDRLPARDSLAANQDLSSTRSG